MSYLPHSSLSAPLPSASPTTTASPSVAAVEWGSPTRAPVIVYNTGSVGITSTTGGGISAAVSESANTTSPEGSQDASLLGAGVVLVALALVLAVGFFAVNKYRASHSRRQAENVDEDVVIGGDELAHDIEASIVGTKYDNVERELSVRGKSCQPESKKPWYKWINGLITNHKQASNEINDNDIEGKNDDIEGSTLNSRSPINEVFTGTQSVADCSALSTPTALIDPEKNKDLILEQFSSGQLLGNELARWCKNMRPVLPSVELLVGSILELHGKDSLIGDCPWAEAHKFGKAIHMMTRDNEERQVEILWAIQKFCLNLGFPTLSRSSGCKGDFLIDNMFKAMYEYCLVSPKAFFMWSNDNTSRNNGKTAAIVQTMEWFEWLSEEHGQAASSSQRQFPLF